MNRSQISALQKYLWLDQKLSPESAKYNIGGYAIIDGHVDFNLFKKAVSIFSEQHLLLKSIFREEMGNPFSIVSEEGFEQGIQYFAKDSKEAALALIHHDFKIPFNIESDQRLFNIWLIKTGPNTFIWYTKLHHLIADGYSFHLFFNEIGAIYEALIGEGLPPSEVQNKTYAQHIEEEIAYYEAETWVKDKKYWTDKYANFIEK